MVLFGVLSRTEAVAAIDFSTLALLFSIMVIIHYATASGLLDGMAFGLVKRGHTPRQMLWIVCLASGVLSAFFVNDTICLLMTPLVIASVKRAKYPLEPYLLALATSSNVGSLMTLTGNPQNMLIGQSSQWTWPGYAMRMLPVGLVCLGMNALVIDRLYARDIDRDGASQVDAPTPDGIPLNKLLAARTVVVLIGLLCAFLLGVPMDLAALVAAVAILILANRPPKEAFDSVDWSLLLFFAGLFVVVQGITKAEGIWIARMIPPVTDRAGSLGELCLFSLASVLGSNLFSNVPFVLLLRGWIAPLPHAQLLWLMLAASSTLAGNLTLMGSVANLIVAQRAADHCQLSFWRFLRVGIVTTTVTVAASVLILWAYHQLGWA